MTVPDGSTVVVHSLPNWLPLTSPWLHALVRHLPPDIVSHVCCEHTSYLEQFNIDHIHSLRDENIARYYWEKALLKLGLRRSLSYLSDVVRSTGAKVVHTHWGNVAWGDREALRRLHIPHVCTFYGKDVNYLPNVDPRWRDRYQELFREIDFVICEGPHMGRCLVALGCPENKVRVIHLGVAVGEVAFRPRSWTPGERLRILIAASFREKKGIPDAIAAVDGLRVKVPDLEVTVIGDASADPRSHVEKARILEVIRRSGLGDRVKLIGYQPHRVFLEEAYRHHIFISPSVTAADGDTEGGAPVSIIEMAATGMPIISTAHCDIPEVVVDGVTGLLAPERDVPGLIRRLQELVDRHGNWGEMLAAGRRRIEQEFDVHVQARRVGEIYRAVAGKGR